MFLQFILTSSRQTLCNCFEMSKENDKNEYLCIALEFRLKCSVRCANELEMEQKAHNNGFGKFSVAFEIVLNMHFSCYPLYFPNVCWWPCGCFPYLTSIICVFNYYSHSFSNKWFMQNSSFSFLFGYSIFTVLIPDTVRIFVLTFRSFHHNECELFEYSTELMGIWCAMV